ncbi:MAG: winged helix-turn-helix domain-containing protein [Patescibacteria group bacterium]|nr:MAG: winged helix-turn-helix domain-containing protein [Patescibacteria group bacterium]
MPSLKSLAYQILKETGIPLHSREIARQALARGFITTGKTPASTLNAILLVDIKTHRDKSRFIKVGPSTFALNKKFKEPKKVIKAGLISANKDKVMSEDFVKNSIIKWLSANGWGHFQFGGLHEKGVDVKAKHHRYSRYFFVEAKGQGKISQVDEVAFVYSLGQIITRMKTSKTTRYYYGLGLPDTSAKIALRRLPWQVAKKLLLYVFSVDVKGNVSQYSWQDLKKSQNLKK